MIRKVAIALCIMAGTSFVAQPAFANDKAAPAAKTDTKKNDKKDPIDALINKATDSADKATKDNKPELAAAYNKLADAYKKEKDALEKAKEATGDDKKTATDEVATAKKDVVDAQKAVNDASKIPAQKADKKDDKKK